MELVDGAEGPESELAGAGTPGVEAAKEAGVLTTIESLYRKFYGDVMGRHGILFSIIGMEFKRRIKRPMFIILMIMAWIATIVPYVMYIYFARISSNMMTLYYDPVTGEFTREMFINSYDTAASFLVLFAAFVGAKLFSESFADRTIVVYLTKPISKTDFLLSRFGTIALTLSLVSLIPVVVLYFSAIALTFKDMAWFINNFWLFVAVVAYGVLIVVTFSNISLAFSCLTKKVYWAMASVMVFVSLSASVGNIINEMAGTEYGTLVTVWANLRVVGYAMFQLDSPYGINWLFSLFMLAIINGVCFAIVFWKVTIMEIE